MFVEEGLKLNDQLTIPYLWMVIGGVVIVIILIVIIRILSKGKRNKYQKQLDEIESRRNELLSSDVESNLAKLRLFERSAVLEERYQAWIKSWHEVKHELTDTVIGMQLDLEDSIESRHYKDFAEKADDITKQLNILSMTITDMQQDIELCMNSEEKIQSQLAETKNFYDQLMKLYSSNVKVLGSHADKIQNQLMKTQDMFHELTMTMKDENKEREAQLFEEIKADLTRLNTILNELPKALVLLNNMILPGLNELKETYGAMRVDGYQLHGLDIAGRIESYEYQLQGIESHIDELQVDSIENSITVLKRGIEETMAILEREHTVREETMTLLKEIEEKMDLLRQSREQIAISWNEVSQRYETNIEDHEQFQIFTDNVLEIENQFVVLHVKCTEKQDSYIVLLDQLKTLDYAIKQANHVADGINQKIDILQKDETHVRKQFEQLRYMIHESKRKIARIDVSVLPNDYFLKLDEAVASLGDIEKQFDIQPLNVKRLTELLDIAQHLVIRFFKDTNMIVKTVLLTERAIVYTNRYRSAEFIDDQLKKAEFLYSEGDYSEALDIALTALEEVEPGMYDMLLQLYEEKLQTA